MIGEFFAMTGPRRLHQVDGSFASKPDEIREVATSFYRDLKTAEEASPSRDESREAVWMHTRKVVTAKMSAELMRPFSGSELHDTLRVLLRDSCPGTDRLLPSIFLRHWDALEPILVQAF